MNPKASLWKAFLHLGVYKYSAEILAFLGSIIISRLLTPSEYGLIAMIAVGYLFIARFSNPGYTDMVIREADSTDHRSEIQWIFALHGLLLCLIMLIVAYPLSWFYHEPGIVAPALVYGAILFLYALPGASESFIMKRKKLALIFRTELWGTVLGLVLTVALAYFGWSYWSLILPHLIIPVFYLAVYQYCEPIPWKLPSLKSLKHVVLKMRSLVTQISKVNLVEYWENQADNFWIGRLQGSAVLGVYNRAFLVSHLPRALFKPLINSVLLPEWQEYPNHPHQINRIYGSLITVTLSLCTLPMVVVMLFPEPISVWLWGKNWVGVAPFLGVLALVMGFQVVCSTSRIMFVLARKERLYARYAWIHGTVIILVVTVTAFISIDTLVPALVLAVLLVKVPSFAFWCLKNSLNLTWKEIGSLLGFPWVVHLMTWLLVVLDLSQLLVFPLLVLASWSLVNLYRERRIFTADG